MAASSPSSSRQRRLPRVSYSAPVRLSGEWSDREPWFVPLLAQSLDLGEGGMALVTPLHLRLGAAVTCSMRLGGRQAYLVGRVVWDHVAPDGTKRVGIQFLSPSDEDTGVMRRLLAIGESHPHRVNLRFDGRPDTLTALARVTRTGLTLSAPLPILRRDTKVRFAFEGLGPSFNGRIDRVRLSHHQGMPALRVGIRVDDASAADAIPRSTSQRDPGVEREDATPSAVEVPIAANSAIAAEPSTLRQRSAQLLAPLPIALALFALGIGAFAHGLVQRSFDQPRAALAVQSRRSDPTPVVAHGAQTPKGAPALTPLPVTRIVSADDTAPFVPTFKWRRDRRELFLPVGDSLAGMRHFAIKSPPAIAINLPNARAPRAGARVPVPHPGVSRIDVIPWQQGSRIRIWTDGTIADYRVEAVPGGLRVVLPAAPDTQR